jgi:hypothetical protein
MLHVNAELILEEPKGPDYEALPAVEQHVNALATYALRLTEAGKISPEAMAFANVFSTRHDAGYCTDIDLIQTDKALATLGNVLEVVESNVDPRAVADYLKRHESNYMAARIIGHGVLSLIENVRYFQEERRLSYQRALGLACILSAHHPGFPITMVSGFLKDDAVIPDESRSAFFIDNNGEDPEVIRRRLAEYGASQLGISTADGLRGAVFGYALDRLSAGSIPDKIRFAEDGVELTGGELIQKKYGLVAGDLDRQERKDEPLVHEFFYTIFHRLTSEMDAAMAAADAAGTPDIRLFVDEQKRSIRDSFWTAQKGAQSLMIRLGLMGRFSELERERKTLRDIAIIFDDDPNLLYALAAYDAIISSIFKTKDDRRRNT